MSSYNESSFNTTVYHKSPLNSGGSPGGKTGAPGEGNCTGCHAGSTLDGTSENVLIVTSGGNVVTDYIPGATHQVSLTMSSNPPKKGFQAIVLDSNNDMMGDFNAGSGTSISSQGSKKYANHTSSSNTNATTTWTWDWIAPACCCWSCYILCSFKFSKWQWKYKWRCDIFITTFFRSSFW